jgi:hypothetical protein
LWARTLIPYRPGTADGYAGASASSVPSPGEVGLRPWLGITASGIAHFFKGRDIGIVDNLACHSMALAPSFDAQTYFGHADIACANFESEDEPKLFDRLTGIEGVENRTTTAAFAQGGFVDTAFQIDSSSTPVVLSPAVLDTSPGSGGSVKGLTTPVAVNFDAEMDATRPNEVVTVSGCSATIKNAKWSAGSALKFDLEIPENSATRRSLSRCTAPRPLARGMRSTGTKIPMASPASRRTVTTTSGSSSALRRRRPASSTRGPFPTTSRRI